MRKKAVIYMVFATIACVVVIAFVIVSYRMASFVMTGKRQTFDEAMNWQSERYDTSFYNGLERETFTVTGFDGYILHAELLKNPEPSDRYIIISHGYTDNRVGSLKYARMYLDMGFNCVLYDQRGHGENAATVTTYGLREGRDAASMAEDARKRFPSASVLGLHGESLGAASVITSLKYKPEVDFVVADCGFADIMNVLREGYRKANAPTILVDIADIGARLRYHVSLRDMRPIDSLDGNTIPILFFHGADDTFILPENSERMAAKTSGYSEIHLIEGAGHAESILKAPDEYCGYVASFLNRVLAEEKCS